MTDETYFLVFNATPNTIGFCLPPVDRGTAWQLVLDTASDTGFVVDGDTFEASSEFPSIRRSVVVLQRIR